MADSDEELDKRNIREKFRPERNDYDRRSDDRRGREPWEDRCCNFWVWMGQIDNLLPCVHCAVIFDNT